MDFVPHDQILSYEEMLRLVALSVKAGIRKVRLTGGEPLVRKGFIPFLEKLSAIEDLREISLTTNGVLLKEFAEDIRRCGICRVNVSLDSLDPEKFARITGRDYLHRVLEGIGEAQRLGFNPIKINVVAMRGINDDEILDFGRLTLTKPYHIRFIEFMPVGDLQFWNRENIVSSSETRNIIGKKYRLIEGKRVRGSGPAKYYKLEGNNC